MYQLSGMFLKINVDLKIKTCIFFFYFLKTSCFLWSITELD